MLGCTVAVVGAMWWWKYLRPGPYPLTSKLRYYTVGDQWDYNVNLSVSQGGATLGDLRAKLTVKIINATLNDQPVLARQYRFAFKGPLKLSVDSTEYIHQDAKTGDVYKLGEKTGAGSLPDANQQPEPDTPGTFSKEMDLTATISPRNGVLHASKRVIGTEVVSSPAGQFHTWKVEGSGSGVSGGVSADATETDWYCPQLGMPVKMYVTTGSDALSTKIEMTMTLESTNVKLQPGRPGS